MKPKENFSNDSVFERKSVKYLLESGLLERMGMSNIVEITDKETQMKGVDLYADIMVNGELLKHQAVDIKSVATFLPTFSQELINITSGNVGWIANDSLETDYYLYAWHDVHGQRDYSVAKKMIMENSVNITDNILALVSKDVVKKIIRKYTGLKCTPQEARYLCRYMRQCGGQYGDEPIHFSVRNRHVQKVPSGRGEQVYLTLTNHLWERPLNAVVRRYELEKNAVSVLHSA